MSATSVEPPPTPARARRRGLSRQSVIWIVIFGVLASAVGLTWLLGGFDRGATPWMGPEVAHGETVETRFWDVAVEGSAWVDPLLPDVVNVRLVLTNKRDEFQYNPTGGLVILRTQEGKVLTHYWCDFPERSSLGPYIPTVTECEYSYESNEITEPPPTEDYEILALVMDQEMSEPLLTEASPIISNVVAHVPLTVVHLEEDS